jgi:DNA adenine methylase
MVGSGALFFRVAPTRGLVADINDDLVNFYRVLRRDHQKLYRALCRLPASRTRYYSLRAREDSSSFVRAVRFAYLNRLCWNGLYRVNGAGQFNVPIGDRLPSRMWFEDRFCHAASALKRVTLVSGDIENTLRFVRTGDLVYIDPPYRRGATDVLGFNRYHRLTFGLEDHLRIADSVRTLTRMRVKVMLTLGASSRVLRLYPCSMNRSVLTTTALISGTGNSRRAVREIVARNYT